MQDPGKGNTETNPVAAIIRLALIMTAVAIGVVAVFYFQEHRSDGVGSSERRGPDRAFVDVTSAAGIDFVHNNGAHGEKLLPETMGGGVAFFDFDNDGDADLLFVNSTWWPWDLESDPDLRPTTARLYRNDSDESGVSFTDVTEGSGLDVPVYGMGVACGDYDSDGFVDIYLTAVGANRLFRNIGDGRFEDVTIVTGTSGGDADWSTSAAFIDHDNDGDLDLFVCNYVDWSRELDYNVAYQLASIGRAYGPPFNFSGSFPVLFENRGADGFVNVAKKAGLEVLNRASGDPLGKALGVSPVDIDADGWIDLVVANDTVQNFVFLNQKDGTFREIGARSGIAFDSFGGTRGAMGIDTAFAAHDADLSIAIGNFANETTSFYVARRDPFLFADEAIGRGVGSSSRDLSTFGVFFFDFDLDGWQDMLAVNGHIEPEVAKLPGGQSYRQPAQLFWNQGGRGTSTTFLPLEPEDVGDGLFEPMAGRGSAFADVDGDGDLDVVVTQVGGPAKLLLNEGPSPEQVLRLKLIGTSSNRDAIGALIEAKAGPRTIRRHVMPTRGYLSQSELPVTISLSGASSAPVTITIRWPGGIVQQSEIGLSEDLVTIVQVD